MFRNLFTTVLLLPCLAHAQAGSLDPSFSGDGLLLSELSFYDDEVHALTVDALGRTIGVGWTDDGSTVGTFVHRLLENGTPDPSFGLGGVAYSVGSGELRYAHAVGLQSSGAIIVAGLVYDVNMDGNAMVLRYLPDGTPDATFGNNGLLSLDYGAGFGFQSAWAMAVTDDDRIVLVGENGENGVTCARLTADGQMDDTFGTGGVAQTGIPFGSGLCVHVYPDGSVLAGGYRIDGDADLLLARFDADGVLDPDFGTAGVAMLDLQGGDTEFMRGLDVLPDGRIALCGSRSFSGLDDEPVVALFTPDGVPDANFGDSGLLVLPYTAPQWGQARTIRAQPDGKLLVCGFRAQPGGVANNDFLLVRLLADGSFDPAFAGAGQVHTDVSGGADRAFAMALAPDGAIVVAGYGTDGSRSSAYARYANDINTSAGNDGYTAPTLVLYPQPAADQVTVRMNHAERVQAVRVLGTDGKQLLSHAPAVSTAAAFTIPLPASMASGTYVVEVRTARGTMHQRLVVAR